MTEPGAVRAAEGSRHAPEDAVDGLRRVLTRTDLILIVVGTVIGSGIFVVPGAVLRQTGGSVGIALLVWFLGGVLSLLGALTYGELGAMDPRSGGLYVYIRDAFGALPAFLYGWALFFVISSGSVATLAVAFSGYLDQIVPLGAVTAKAVAVTMIVAVGTINIVGTSKSASVQVWSTLLKAGAIVVMSVVLATMGRAAPSTAALWPDTLDTSLLAGVGLAMIGTLWAYEGWQYVTFAAGEARDPQRDFPLSIGLGTTILIALYLAANWAYVAALGPAGVAASDSVASEAVRTVLGEPAAVVITLTILVSMFSAANGLTLTATRVYFAMARDGVFFRRLADVHPGFGTPAVAIGASSAWAIVLAVSGTFEQLLTYVVFVGWVFYGLGAASVFWYRRHRPDRPRPFRVPGYPVTPALFVAAAVSIVLNTALTLPLQAALGVGVVLTGAPAFWMWRRRADAA